MKTVKRTHAPTAIDAVAGSERIEELGGLNAFDAADWLRAEADDLGRRGFADEARALRAQARQLRQAGKRRRRELWSQFLTDANRRVANEAGG